MSTRTVDHRVPACGLYRTTTPFPGQEAALPEGRLVMFHNHSEQGPPIVQLPEHNVHNRWHFRREGYLVTDEVFMATLESLKPEGFYRLREHFHPNDAQVVAEEQLVQLGYNPQGEPIIFFPTVGKDANMLVFPAQGMKIPEKIYGLLEPLTTRGPFEPEAPHLH